MDIAAPTGTPVHAAACGTVSLAGQQSGYGNIVCVTHTSQFSTCYAHLSRFGVSNGAQVQQGQVIGYVGCTGSCTGPHLHFETRVNGQAQNPTTYRRAAPRSRASGRRGRREQRPRHDGQLDRDHRRASGRALAPRVEVQATPSRRGHDDRDDSVPADERAERAASEHRPTAGPSPAEVAAPAEVRPSPSPSRRRSRRPQRSRPSRSPAEVAAAAASRSRPAPRREVAPEPVAVEAQVAPPAAVAAEPVAAEAQAAVPAEPVAGEAPVAHSRC